MWKGKKRSHQMSRSEFNETISIAGIMWYNQPLCSLLVVYNVTSPSPRNCFPINLCGHPFLSTHYVPKIDTSKNLFKELCGRRPNLQHCSQKRGAVAWKQFKKQQRQRGGLQEFFTIVILLPKCTDEGKECVSHPVNVQELQIASPWHARYCSK